MRARRERQDTPRQMIPHTGGPKVQRIDFPCMFSTGPFLETRPTLQRHFEPPPASDFSHTTIFCSPYLVLVATIHVVVVSDNIFDCVSGFVADFA